MPAVRLPALPWPKLAPSSEPHMCGWLMCHQPHMPLHTGSWHTTLISPGSSRASRQCSGARAGGTPWYRSSMWVLGSAGACTGNAQPWRRGPSAWHEWLAAGLVMDGWDRWGNTMVPQLRVGAHAEVTAQAGGALEGRSFAAGGIGHGPKQLPSHACMHTCRWACPGSTWGSFTRTAARRGSS